MTKTEKLFNVRELMAVATAAQRVNSGFIKASGSYASGIPNKGLIYNHYYGKTNPDTLETEDAALPLLEEDFDTADEIIMYFKGLSFKAIDRSLSEFETAVLELVTQDEVPKQKLGIAASLPSIYAKNIAMDDWSQKEMELARSSNFIGDLGFRGRFEDITVQFIRPIKLKRTQTTTNLYFCTDPEGNLIKFFNDNPTLVKKGDTVTISAFVRGQEISTYSGGKETIVNRVSIVS